MNPKCHRCTKTVYPVEKLNCLDKTWHKGCFNCEVCHMTLTMKTYKGYKKLPYCNTHYPTTKFTAVADTPENMRLKKNTTNQSTVVYHRDFEQEKGKYTAVTDDPETLRTRKTQEQASDIAYQSKAATKSQTPATRYDHREGRSTSQSQEEYTPAEPEVVSAPPVAPSGGGGRYVAVYDYTAADDDEVTFVEGDHIVNGQIIDEGWMTGTVESTGQTGMLPSNYVEAC